MCQRRDMYNRRKRAYRLRLSIRRYTHGDVFITHKGMGHHPLPTSAQFVTIPIWMYFPNGRDAALSALTEVTAPGRSALGRPPSLAFSVMVSDTCAWLFNWDRRMVVTAGHLSAK